MKENKEFRALYAVLIVMVIFVSTMGSTYAYFTARTNSAANAVSTASTTYSISMDIDPVYTGFSMIPMNDEYALKGIKNECMDKYNRGVCHVYKIRVYGYSDTLDYVSGFMDVTTNNIDNLSYMTFGSSDTYDEEDCVEIDGKYYCKSVDVTPVGEGHNLSLGSSYDVVGKADTNILLMVWLTNLDVNQNDSDIGDFNATVTMQAGNGGEIKGTIASAIVLDNEQGGGSGGE